MATLPVFLGAFSIACLVALGLVAPGGAAIIEVNRTADDADPRSLRWAILLEKQTEEADEIVFSATLGGQEIVLSSALPVILESVTIGVEQGGSDYGGAVFVMEGGTLHIVGSSFGSIAGGNSVKAGEGDGAAAGRALARRLRTPG